MPTGKLSFEQLQRLFLDAPEVRDMQIEGEAPARLRVEARTPADRELLALKCQMLDCVVSFSILDPVVLFVDEDC